MAPCRRTLPDTPAEMVAFLDHHRGLALIEQPEFRLRPGRAAVQPPDTRSLALMKSLCLT